MKSFSYAIAGVVLLISSLACAFDGKREEKLIGGYKIILSQDFESGLGTVAFFKGHEKIFEESGIDDHYYIGNEFEENPKKSKLWLGKDLTGRKLPNVIVSNWTGGAHCCHFLTIYELGENVKKLVTVDALSSAILLTDLNHDGLPEIEFWDGAIDYQFASFAGSPGGRVVLEFQKDRYQVAPRWMNRSMPKNMPHLKSKIKKAFAKKDSPDLPYIFLKTMMDLSYSGHFSEALKLSEEVWPSGKPGLEKFKKEYSEALGRSMYWTEFQKVH